MMAMLKIYLSVIIWYYVHPTNIASVNLVMDCSKVFFTILTPAPGVSKVI